MLFSVHSMIPSIVTVVKWFSDWFHLDMSIFTSRSVQLECRTQYLLENGNTLLLLPLPIQSSWGVARCAQRTRGCWDHVWISEAGYVTRLCEMIRFSCLSHLNHLVLVTSLSLDPWFWIKLERETRHSRLKPGVHVWDVLNPWFRASQQTMLTLM